MAMKPIILIGLPGCGKTSTALSLSTFSGLPVLDTDVLLSTRRGIPISDWFRLNGEEDFRKAELDLLIELSASRKNQIISTGGGMPCISGASSVLRAMGEVYFLNTPPLLILQRIQHDTSRPLLAFPERQDVLLNELHQKRIKDYIQTAHHIIEIHEHETPQNIAEKILTLHTCL